MFKATGQHGSYYEAWRRKHNVQPDLLQSDKRLTDTSTYMTFLETQLQRVSAACTSMKGLTTTIEQQQHETAALEQKLLSVTELVTLAQSFSEEQAKQQQRELAEQRAVIESMSSKLAELERSAQAASLHNHHAVNQQAPGLACMSSSRSRNDSVHADDWKHNIEQQLDALRNQWQHEQLQLDELNAQLEEHLRQQQQQQQQQTAQSPVALSSEWQQLQDDAGRTYYYNTQTGLSSWQGPGAATQYSTTNNETVTAVTDETAAVNSEHQQHFDTEVSATASSAHYESTTSASAHNIDHTLELGQLREAVALIALSQETAEQLVKQHIADAIAALR
eukprot:16401-Heterococcus_DN1.PRE.2